MQPKRILIIGNYGAGNLGDDAILGGILSDLKAAGFKGELEVTHGGADTSPEIYKSVKKVPFYPVGIRSRLDRKLKAKARAAIERADLAILGGGGLFVDTESIMAPYIWSKQASACRKYGTPYITYGQSLGPLKHIASRHLAKRTFKHAKAVHVRDSASKELLEKLKIKDVHLGSDPAFTWIQEQSSGKSEAKLILSLRSWDELADSKWELLLNELKSFARRKKLKTILIQMDATNSAETEALRKSGWELHAPSSAEDALKLFKSSEFAVCMRLHANLFALSSGAPLLAISYSTKVESILKDLKVKGGLEILKTNKLGPKKLKNALKAVEKAGQTIFNMEGAIVQNQAFLAHALSDLP